MLVIVILPYLSQFAEERKKPNRKNPQFADETKKLCGWLSPFSLSKLSQSFSSSVLQNYNCG